VSISPAIRDTVATTDRHQCVYCQTQKQLIGRALEIDHIVPESLGGDDDLSNLCQACVTCNRHKAAKTMGIDPQTNENAPLFHPRRQEWSAHFSWSEDNVRVIGLTPIGRATVELLQMNNDDVVRSRRIWVSWGYHPPRNEID